MDYCYPNYSGSYVPTKLDGGECFYDLSGPAPLVDYNVEECERAKLEYRIMILEEEIRKLKEKK